MFISKLLFPNHKDIQSEYLHNISSRNWQVITRFAPSPTWFLHIWWVYTSLISQIFAHQNDWLFVLRIEDTDQNRKIENWVEQIAKELAWFGIRADEGIQRDGHKAYHIWNYWPYIQSERKDIYISMVCKMLDFWLAYPCFMSPEELDETRKLQTISKQPTGIYWHFAKHRDITLDQIQEFLWSGKNFVIRYKNYTKPWDRINFHDLMKWYIDMDDNYEDLILLKSDWLPTYHMAHIIDDYMMWTTHVIRTDERLPSVPKHIQLYNALLNSEIINRPIRKYVHPSPIMKNENGNRRKLSKRKDPEAKASFFTDVWYPIWWLKDYLLTIIDTKYNDSKSKDVKAEYGSMDFANFSTAWAIMDIDKLNHFSAEYIYSMDLWDLRDNLTQYIQNFDLQNPETSQYHNILSKLKNAISKSPETYTNLLISILSFDREKKLFKNYLDICIYILPFFDEEFDNWEINELLLSNPIPQDQIKQFKSEYISNIHQFWNENWEISISKEERFEDLKNYASKYNIAINNAEFKQWWFVGKIWDLAAILRIYIYGSTNSPDLYTMISILGKDQIISRLSK